MNFNFGEVLSRAWQIIWKHKVLWIFGILAGCSQGRYNSGNNGRGGGTGAPGNLPPQLERVLDVISQNIIAFSAIALSIACILLILAIFLGTIGKIGLIRGGWQADQGAERLLFGPLFSESMPYFWRMFGLSLLLFIPVFILVVVLVIGFAIVAVSASQGGRTSLLGIVSSIPLLIGCLCLFIPVMWVLGMIFKQAERAIVLDGEPVFPALSRGWNIFTGNLGPILVMAIILAVIGLVAGFIIALPILIMIVPAAIAFAAAGAHNWTPLAIALVGLCIYIPVLLLLNGILTSYTETAWTLTFLRLTRKPDQSEPILPENVPPPGPDEGDKTIISSSHA